MDQMYEYQQLPGNDTHIRIMAILGRDNDQILSLTLKTVKLYLDDPWRYDAISYVWGPATPLKLVRIDGRKFKVRENIWRFLNLYWTKTSAREHHRHLWIDAICINQEDTREKSEQVSHMRDIFFFSRRVLCWFGEASEDSFHIDALADHDTSLAMIKRQLQEDLSNFPPYEIIDTRDADAESRLCKALQPILANAYWSRLWIVQEVCVGSWPLMITSFGLIPVEYVWQVSQEAALHPREWDDALEDGLSRIDRIVQMRVSSRDNRAHTGNPKPPPADLLGNCASFLNFGCQDPRDHIYAILGIMDERDAFEPDYSESPSDTLRRLLDSMADEKASFSIADFLSVAEALTREPGDTSWELKSHDIDQPCYVRFVLSLSVQLTPENGCRHSSFESWVQCVLTRAEAAHYAWLHGNETESRRHCEGLWSDRIDITNTIARLLYIRTTFSVHSDQSFPRQLFIFLATPSQVLENPEPLTHTAIVTWEEEFLDATLKSCRRIIGYELSGPLREDLRAYHLAHIAEKSMAEIEYIEGAASWFDVPLRGGSLAQLCDILNGVDATPAELLWSFVVA